MKLQQAFSITRGDVVSIVGAGGKTSLLVGLGYELAEAGWRVLATSTAAFAPEQLALFPACLPLHAPAAHISQALSERQFVLLHEPPQAGEVPPTPQDWVQQLLDRVDSDILLVEADEADGLPLKAPRPQQPYIPAATTVLIVQASLRAVGQPLDEAHIYHARAMSDQFGFAEGSPVLSPWLAQVLRDEQLGLRNSPAAARVMLYLNHTPERGYLLGRARSIARLCLQNPRISAVVLGSLRAYQPALELRRRVGALLLATDGTSAAAAGEKALLRRVALLRRSGISPILLVAGQGARAYAHACEKLDIGMLPAAGQMHELGPLQAGLAALPAELAAVLVLPAASPRLQAPRLQALLQAYARGGAALLHSPGHCAYPLLIGRPYWDEIDELPPTSELATFLQSHRAQTVPTATWSLGQRDGGYRLMRLQADSSRRRL